MPILKQLVSGSSQSKRRSRADLTAEMISAPLGDFRHTMHVGRGGDAFGDTSFLSTRSGEPPREQQTQPSSSPNGGGMKHAESILSFHVDLGPSMLGDILSVMDKKGFNEDKKVILPRPGNGSIAGLDDHDTLRHFNATNHKNTSLSTLGCDAFYDIFPVLT
uniref:CDC42 effector protein (Rho GTPase binding) 4b n=1 Tax=Astyanax mexicanus TaxID=7994 RepID=A0A8B9HDY6_ASTMX